MRQKMTHRSDRGTSISLDIPAEDADIYGNSAVDDVLLFLSRHQYDQFTQRNLASRTDHAEATVRRGVHVLEANDLVESDNKGNRKLVSINRDRLQVPDDPFLRIPQTEFQRPVKAAVEKLTDGLDDIVGILLYGSVARGEADCRSDIDLWVAVRDDRSANQRGANDIKAELEDRAFDGERYEFHIAVESLASIPAFTDDIGELVRSGIPVYEPDEFEMLRELLLEEGDDE